MKAITIFDNEKFLRQHSKNVDIENDKELFKDISTLKEYCMQNDVFAMAGIQLGINKRILYVCAPNLDKDKSNESSHIVMINPVVLEQKGKTFYWEACHSCMPYFGLVERPYKMKIAYYNVDGQKIVQDFEGFVCTILSHEIDHFDGIFHMDRAVKVMKAEKEKRIAIRKQEPYKIISKTCKFEYKPIEKLKEYGEKTL